MAKVFTDAEIAALLADRKPVSKRQRELLLAHTRQSGTDEIARIRVVGASGRKYLIAVRKSLKHKNQFSIRLAIRTSRYRGINLVRCNGWHSPHVNVLERKSGKGIKFIPANTFHIHALTERYQQFGKGEHYAEATDKFDSCQGAIEFLCYSFGCYDPEDDYPSKYPLFKE